MNLFGNIPAQLPEELTSVLQEGPGVRIERIVSKGHRSPRCLLVRAGAGEMVGRSLWRCNA
jgi:hypothetical protein